MSGKVYTFKTQGQIEKLLSKTIERTVGKNGKPLKRPLREVVQELVTTTGVVTITRKRRKNIGKYMRKRRARVHTR